MYAMEISMNNLPDIKTQFTQWYQEVIAKADLADHAPVRGCIVIKPYGNDIWENIKKILDKKIRDTGHSNALFPLLIPESFLKKEADHIAGFAPELAVVTHAGGKELAEPLVVRPTSETIIHYMFTQWIRSWRDLPLLINQWASVVRWEMRPRAFLRTTEFFWQEGHTAHATREEAEAEVQLMLNEYKDLAENYLAIPVITGRKSEGEKFPGAVRTYTFEGFMPDAKALQMGTSHLLSQSFAHAFDMKFQSQTGEINFPWLTSWGATSRLVGAVIMVHGDQKGLILPPAIAPYQCVIIPIFKNDEDKEIVLRAATALKVVCENQNVRIHIDKDMHKTPGNKFYHWEMRGVPLRIEIGPRDVLAQQIVVANRLTGEKKIVALKEFIKTVSDTLKTFQQSLFDKALSIRNNLLRDAKTFESVIGLGQEYIVKTGFCGSRECENALKEHTLSIRCVLENTKNFKHCFKCSGANCDDVIIARSY